VIDAPERWTDAVNSADFKLTHYRLVVVYFG